MPAGYVNLSLNCGIGMENFWELLLNYLFYVIFILYELIIARCKYRMTNIFQLFHILPQNMMN